MKKLEFNYLPFYLGLFLSNVFIWLPVLLHAFPTLGLGHDNQIFQAAINSELRRSNSLLDPVLMMYGAREDIFSTPFFGVLYPFYWTFDLGRDFDYSQNLFLDFLSIAFHSVLASISFALLLKKVGCRNSIAVIFGCYYAYSLIIKFWSAWIWSSATYAWLPFALIGIHDCVISKKYLRGIFFIGAGFGFIALGTSLGIVYAFYIGFFFCLICYLYAYETGKINIKGFASMVCGGFIAFLVGASHLLPTILRSNDYIRWHSKGETVGGFKPPYEATLVGQFDFSLLAFKQLFVPTGWSFGLGHMYVGGAVIALFLYSMLKLENKKITFFVSLIVVFFLFDIFGDNTFIHSVTYQLPMLGSIRYPVSNLFISVFFLLLFAGIGAEKFLCKLSKETISQIVFFLIIVATTLVLYANKDSIIFSKHYLWLILLPGIVASAYLLGFPILKKITVPFVLLILVAQLAQNTMLFHPKIPKENQLYVKCEDFLGIVDLLKRNYDKNKDWRIFTFVTKSFKPPSSCLNNLKLNNQLLESVAMIIGWNTTQIYMSPRPYEKYKITESFTKLKTWENVGDIYRSGITHVLSNGELDKRLFERIDIQDNLKLYQVKDLNLSGSLFGCFEGTASVHSFRSNYGSRTILVGDAQIAFCDQKESLFKIISKRKIRNGYIYKLDSNDSGYLVTDQFFNKDWKVFVNGKKVIPFSVDGYRMAIKVGIGKNDVTMKYEPSDFRIAKILTYLGMIILLLLLLRVSMKNFYLTNNRFN